jgi:biopolymer transport protein ExbD
MMGIQVGGASRGTFNEMNVVPLIDILLVLLVIFMSASHRQKGLEAMVPQAVDRPSDPVDIIVVEVLSSGELRINQDPVAWDPLADRMEAIYKERARKVAFIRGEAPVEFALVARAIDLLHGSGISVGLLTPGLEQQR